MHKIRIVGFTVLIVDALIDRREPQNTRQQMPLETRLGRLRFRVLRVFRGDSSHPVFTAEGTPAA